MTTLAELQRRFAAALRDPQLAAPEAVRPDKTRAQSKRFDIYRNNVAVSLREALAATYPAVKALVGEAFFNAVALLYSREEPPRSPILQQWGGGFGLFLERFPPAQGVPYLGDVARLEWARLRAYHAKDADAVAITALAALPPQAQAAARFSLHPSLTLLASSYPIASLWAAALRPHEGVAIELDQSETVAIVRPELSVQVRVLPPGGGHFVAALQAGASLAEAAAGASQQEEEFDLVLHLQGLFDLGLVTAVNAE